MCPAAACNPGGIVHSLMTLITGPAGRTQASTASMTAPACARYRHRGYHFQRVGDNLHCIHLPCRLPIIVSVISSTPCTHQFLSAYRLETSVDGKTCISHCSIAALQVTSCGPPVAETHPQSATHSALDALGAHHSDLSGAQHHNVAGMLVTT